jgi:hypothetical protein
MFKKSKRIYNYENLILAFLQLISSLVTLMINYLII